MAKKVSLYGTVAPPACLASQLTQRKTGTNKTPLASWLVLLKFQRLDVFSLHIIISEMSLNKIMSLDTTTKCIIIVKYFFENMRYQMVDLSIKGCD